MTDPQMLRFRQGDEAHGDLFILHGSRAREEIEGGGPAD